MGASLGALAAFHAHRVAAAPVRRALPRSRASSPARPIDGVNFARFVRVTRFVRPCPTGESWRDPVPVVITCGQTEENAANNRALREALHRQRYDVRMYEHPDVHNWVSWRDVLHPHLIDLLDRLWG